MTRRARPIRTHHTSTHPPISCFCFAVWMLEVDYVKKKKKPTRLRCSGSAGEPSSFHLRPRSHLGQRTRRVGARQLSRSARTFRPAESVSVALFLGGRWGQRRRSGFRPGDRPRFPKGRAASRGGRRGRFGGRDGAPRVPGRAGRRRRAPRIHVRLVQPGHHVSEPCGTT